MEYDKGKQRRIKKKTEGKFGDSQKAYSREAQKNERFKGKRGEQRRERQKS